jgi:hypothetical protein
VWVGGGKNCGLYSARDLEFFLDLVELLIAMQSASGGDVSQSSEKEREAERLGTRRGPEGTAQVVPERECNEGDEAAADDDEILVGSLLPHGLNDQSGEAGDDPDGVNEVEDGLWADDRRREKERKKEDGQKAGDSTAEGSEKSGCVEVEEGRNRYEVVDGYAQRRKGGGAGYQERECTQLQPQTLTIEDGEQGQPEEHRIELAAEKGEGCRCEAERGESGAEEQIRSIVVTGLQYLAGGERLVAYVHTSG